MRKEKEKDCRKGEEEDWKGMEREVKRGSRYKEKDREGGTRKEEHWNFLAKEKIARENSARRHCKMIR